MSKYRTKPFEIEAVQWQGDNLAELKEFGALLRGQGGKRHDLEVYDYLQDTWVLVNENDYVIKGMKGEFYPCDPEVFNNKYEPI